MKRQSRNRLEIVLSALREKYDGVPEVAYERLLGFADAIKKWSVRTQLVSNRDISVLVDRHIVESLGAPFVFDFKEVQSIVDLGSGAGLPGIPLSIVFPQKSFSLVEPMRKRVLFLKHIVRVLSLKNVTVLHGRMEHFEFVDPGCVVVARAVASLSELIEWSVASVQDEFALLAMKGGDLKEELDDAQRSWPGFGFEIVKYPEAVSSQSADKKLVVVQKKAE